MEGDVLNDRIDNYLSGKMDDDGKSAFEAEMLADEALANEVELHKLALLAVQRLASRDLQAKFSGWESDIASANRLNKAGAGRNPWLLAFLGFFILSAVLLYLYIQRSKTLREAKAIQRIEVARRDSMITGLNILIQKKEMDLKAGQGDSISRLDSLNLEIQKLKTELNRLQQSPSKPTTKTPVNQQMALAFAPSDEYNARGIATRGTATSEASTDPDLSRISAFYSALADKKYQEAVGILKEIRPTDENGQRIVLYELPYALFYAGDFGEALFAFLELQKIERAEADKVEWYIVLCYLADGRHAHLTEALEVILNDQQHQYHADALKLEKELKSKNRLLGFDMQSDSAPFYVVNVGVVQKEDMAKSDVAKLKSRGYAAGYLWIPDYASLSGAKHFSVYIGPFATEQECEIATEEYRKIDPRAYGTLVSHKPGRVQIDGIGKIKRYTD